MARVFPMLAAVSIAVWLAQALPSLRALPSGGHSWRETDGLIVARNYCVEHAPFFEPRVNNRGDSDGRTGMELPLLPWIAGRIGCVTSDFITPWRVLSLLFSLLLCACVFRLAQARFGGVAGPLAAICFATAPIVPYFSRTTQPDAAAAGLAGLAMLLALRSVPGAFACVTLAALVKLPAAVYLLPVLAFAGLRLSTASMAAASAAIALAYNRYAAAVEDATGIHNFGVSRTAAQLLAEWQSRETWVLSFVQRPFDVWLFPAVPVVLIAVLLWKRSQVPRDIAVLGVTALAYILLCGHSGAHHEYYGLLLLPALCVMGGWAMNALRGVRGFVPALVVFVAAGCVYEVRRARSAWASHEREWTELSAFFAQRPPQRIAVFADGNPRLFWFSAQVGRFGEMVQPTVREGELGAVDRLRLEERAPSIEAALQQQGCTEVFANAAGWICEARPR